MTYLLLISIKPLLYSLPIIFLPSPLVHSILFQNPKLSHQEMSYSALNGDIMVRNGRFWTIGEYSYFDIISYYILSRDKFYRGLKIWIWKSRGIIPFIVSVELPIPISTVVVSVRGQVLH